MVEDCEEAFVKNPDGHPLVLYLKTDADHSLTGPARQLLERVNAADKAAKIKVCCVNLHHSQFPVNAPQAAALQSSCYTEPTTKQAPSITTA